MTALVFVLPAFGMLSQNYSYYFLILVMPPVHAAAPFPLQQLGCLLDAQDEDEELITLATLKLVW